MNIDTPYLCDVLCPQQGSGLKIVVNSQSGPHLSLQKLWDIRQSTGSTCVVWKAGVSESIWRGALSECKLVRFNMKFSVNKSEHDSVHRLRLNVPCLGFVGALTETEGKPISYTNLRLAEPRWDKETIGDRTPLEYIYLLTKSRTATDFLFTKGRCHCYVIVLNKCYVLNSIEDRLMRNLGGSGK